MNKTQFIATYIANFLAAYTAQRYTELCQNGWENWTPPVDDALTLAEQAWEATQQDYALRSVFSNN